MEKNYQPNSNRFKEEKAEREKLEKIVTGNVKRKKKSELSKLVGLFVSADAGKVGDHAFSDVIVPTVKRALVDVVTDSINMLVFGDTRSSRSYGTSNYVPYDSRFSSGTTYQTTHPRSSYDFDNVVLDSRGEAEAVLARLNESLLRYGIVRVADLYDLVGMQCNYTDNKYGWTSLHTADIVRGRDGYLLKLPKAMPID